jgi:hypothetical protein
VNENVLLIAPLTWGEVPVQSIVIRSSCLLIVHKSRIGLPTSMPSSSIQSSKLKVPSGRSRIAARVICSE